MNTIEHKASADIFAVVDARGAGPARNRIARVLFGLMLQTKLAMDGIEAEVAGFGFYDEAAYNIRVNGSDVKRALSLIVYLIDQHAGAGQFWIFGPDNRLHDNLEITDGEVAEVVRIGNSAFQAERLCQEIILRENAEQIATLEKQSAELKERLEDLERKTRSGDEWKDEKEGRE